jgi:putative ABC transport system permease protein
LMEIFLQDVRYGVRTMLRGRGVTLMAALSLTLGIGANTAIFSIVNAVLIRPLPYPQPDQLVRIYEKSPRSALASVSYPNFLDWRQQSQSFEGMSVFIYQGFTITGAQGPERAQGQMISANLFSVLGVQPAIGRGMLPEEDKPGAPSVVVVSHGLWQSRFGGDPNFLGKPININGKDHTVIGILPANFHFYSPADLFIAIGAQENPSLQARGIRPDLRVVGRLKAGAAIEQARAEMERLASVLAQQYPESNTGYGVSLLSMQEDLVGTTKPVLFSLLVAVGFVLLIACANVANMLLARAVSRRKEIGMRTALGASRARIIRLLLLESVLLALVGGAVGLLLARWGTRALIAAMPESLPRVEDIGIDGSVLAFTLAVSLLTGIVFGLIPALQASKPSLNELLKEGERTSAGARHRLRNLLVISEVALAFILLIGSGLMIKTLIKLRGVDPGLNPRNVLTMKAPLSRTTYNTPSKIKNFYQQLLDRLNNTPGVEAAAITADMPFTGTVLQIPYWIGAGPRPRPEEMLSALFCPTSANYAKATGVPLLKGRFIDEHDTQDRPAIVVVDEYLARGLFPNDDPIGKQLTLQGFARSPDITCEIVGVVGHVKHHGLDADSQLRDQFQLYFPYLQVSDFLITRMTEGMTVVARTSSDPLALVSDVRNQVLALDKDQPVTSVRTMEQIISTSIARRRFSALLFGVFAAAALILAAVGIYGVMSYAVTQRTHEIGVRVAVGARPADVLKMVVRQGMTLAIIGVVIGVAASIGLTRLMEKLLFGVSATDPATFAIIAVSLAVVALAACYIPARRATTVDPLVALRHE